MVKWLVEPIHSNGINHHGYTGGNMAVPASICTYSFNMYYQCVPNSNIRVSIRQPSHCERTEYIDVSSWNTEHGPLAAFDAETTT